MISGTPLEIARCLAKKAKTGSRTTYEQVAEEIGWGHPNRPDFLHWAPQMTFAMIFFAI